jgi:hypothetical protein
MEFEGGDRVDEGSVASGERERERERDREREREISVLRWRDTRGKKD